MTENEALKVLKRDLEIQKENKALPDGIAAIDVAIKALEEIQQYRAIGTVERFRFLQEVCDLTGDELEHIANSMIELKNYRAIGTVEEIKNAYGRGYNQGGIDRAEELQKCREYGYNKAIDEFAEALLNQKVVDKSVVKRIAEQMKGE